MLIKLLKRLTIPVFSLPQPAAPKKSTFLKMQQQYILPKENNLYFDLFDKPFKNDETGFEVTSAYLALSEDVHLKQFDVSVWNLRPNIKTSAEFVSFGIKKKILGGDLVLSKAFFASRREEFITFATERGLCIGSHALIRDSLCLKIKQASQVFYLIDPYALQPKSYLFKPQRVRALTY